MKKIFYTLLLFMSVLSGCKSTDYLNRKDDNKALKDAIAALAKKPDNEKALAAVPVLYQRISEKYKDEIETLKTSTDINRFDKLLSRYHDLQQAYSMIMANSAAYKLVNPVDYTSQEMEVRDQAAQAFYDAGLKESQNKSKAAQRKAYEYFSKVDKFTPGYKDVRKLMDETYENSILDVVINPITDNSFFMSSGFGDYGIGYANDYFQRSLVRELQFNNNSNRFPARFYTDLDYRGANVRPDRVVDLRLRNLDVPYNPQSQTQTYNRQANVEVGRDTSGRPVYNTVYATIRVSRTYLTARGDMDVMIRDTESGMLSSRNFSETATFEQSNATYSGDVRALSASDRSLINQTNTMYQMRREDLLTELYRKIYPNVKYFLESEVRRW